MDAVKILGGLLGSGAVTSGQGEQMLGGLLGSVLGGQTGNPGGGGAGALGDLLGAGAIGGRTGAGAAGGGNGGLGDLLGAALGGGGQSRGKSGGPSSDQAGGGLGDLLGGVLGGQAAGGGLGDLLGGALGGGAAPRRGSTGRPGVGGGGGGIGGMLGSMAVAALVKYAADRMAAGGGGARGVAGLLGDPGAAEAIAPFESAEANAQAELMIEAMIGAAKADGRIDAQERDAILGRLGDLDAQERDFVQRKLDGPANARALAARVPAGIAEEIYAASLMAMTLDERSEALYLRDLADGLRLDAATCNRIHGELGAPAIFR